MPHDTRSPSYSSFHGLWHQMCIHTKAIWPPQTPHGCSSFHVDVTDCWVDRDVRRPCHWMTMSAGKHKRDWVQFCTYIMKHISLQKVGLLHSHKKHRQVVQKYIFIEFTNTVISNTFSKVAKALTQNLTQMVKVSVDIISNLHI